MGRRITLNLDDDLFRQAREFTGIQEKTALIHAALRELISRGAARRLVALGGSMPEFQAGRRRRPHGRSLKDPGHVIDAGERGGIG
jgi:Arc/MetJ family transcription regulator